MPVGREALIELCHAAYEASPTKPAKSEDREEADRLMLGLVGHPNVGKSSLINHLMGGKVVSVKATPGHTKTLQTLILDDRTCLCDSPGVVFPRLEVPREAQIVGMLIPLAQVREPFSAIRWVMERAVVPLHEVFNLKPVTLRQVFQLRDAGTDALRLEGTEESEASQVPWSPMLLCAQYAIQRGFVRGGRPDCARAGMEILEKVLEGRVPYTVPPPDHVPTCLKQVQEEEDSEDSEWQVAEEDFESESEKEAEKDKGLFESFGVEPKTAGGCTIKSRKKQARKQKREAEEAGEECVESKQARPRRKQGQGESCCYSGSGSECAD